MSRRENLHIIFSLSVLFISTNSLHLNSNINSNNNNNHRDATSTIIGHHHINSGVGSGSSVNSDMISSSSSSSISNSRVLNNAINDKNSYRIQQGKIVKRTPPPDIATATTTTATKFVDNNNVADDHHYKKTLIPSLQQHHLPTTVNLFKKGVTSTRVLRSTNDGNFLKLNHHYAKLPLQQQQQQRYNNENDYENNDDDDDIDDVITGNLDNINSDHRIIDDNGFMMIEQPHLMKFNDNNYQQQHQYHNNLPIFIDKSNGIDRSNSDNLLLQNNEYLLPVNELLTPSIPSRYSLSSSLKSKSTKYYKNDNHNSYDDMMANDAPHSIDINNDDDFDDDGILINNDNDDFIYENSRNNQLPPKALQELFHHKNIDGNDDRNIDGSDKIRSSISISSSNNSPSNSNKLKNRNEKNGNSSSGSRLIQTKSINKKWSEKQQQQQQKSLNKIKMEKKQSTKQQNKRSNSNNTPQGLPPGSHSIASQLMLRTARGQRQYDVPQIECPSAMDGMERFACPTPDRQGRYRCIDDHVLCDGFIDCPEGEDEDRSSCMFYKTTKAHLDVLADALLRWARGR